jgi:hypothetical protein
MSYAYINILKKNTNIDKKIKNNILIFIYFDNYF